MCSYYADVTLLEAGTLLERKEEEMEKRLLSWVSPTVNQTAPSTKWWQVSVTQQVYFRVCYHVTSERMSSPRQMRDNKTIKSLCKSLNITQDQITEILPPCKGHPSQQLLERLRSFWLGKTRLFSEERETPGKYK